MGVNENVLSTTHTHLSTAGILRMKRSSFMRLFLLTAPMYSSFFAYLMCAYEAGDLAAQLSGGFNHRFCDSVCGSVFLNKRVCFPPADGHAAFRQSDDELFRCVSVKSSSCAQTRIAFSSPPNKPSHLCQECTVVSIFIGYRTSRDSDGNPRLRQLKTWSFWQVRMCLGICVCARKRD